jgi:hypothetical protein
LFDRRPPIYLGLLTVSDSKPDDVSKFPSAMGVATRLACSRAVQEGVKVELLLREAGLTRQQLTILACASSQKSD